ncbi:MAG: ABC transporter substrate-binding protein [Candidatus Rokubacteria bacterium]|nr:ABC transporter substrate-binding protein [Candidatus Rokubacteria bacterium]MBI3824626.1 ABC transporter substrate-binding protein [Candidatus Rokubacteria bacterium]
MADRVCCSRMGAPSRRIFALAFLLLATEVEVEAQPAAKTPRIGVLFLTSPASVAGAAGLEALRASLRDLGYVEGRTIAIEYRSAEGRAERLPELAAQLVERKVDVIVTGGGNVSTLAARKATTTIPIVMTGSWRAVEAGLVDSLARPGGNITGLTVPRELGLKQIELLREVVPSLSRIVIFSRKILDTPAQRAQAKALIQEFLRVTVDILDVEEPEDLARAFAATPALRPHAMITGPDPLFFEYRNQVLDFARSARLPAMYPFRDFVDAGGLMSYSINPQDVVRRTARFVDRIIKGAKPVDLPVEEPTMYELVINVKTASALGLVIPPSLRLRADHVIE